MPKGLTDDEMSRFCYSVKKKLILRKFCKFQVLSYLTNTAKQTVCVYFPTQVYLRRFAGTNSSKSENHNQFCLNICLTNFPLTLNFIYGTGRNVLSDTSIVDLSATSDMVESSSNLITSSVLLNAVFVF